jgi:hypothetical protein
VRATILGLAFAMAIPAEAIAEAPLRIRNLSPIAGLFGLPRALGGTVLENGRELSFDAEVANNFTSNRDPGNFAFFDGETTTFSYAYRGALADGWEWGLEVPFIDHDGGFLDAGIDNFHDVFGFDDNGRERANRNQIDYFVRFDGQTFVNFQDQVNDWGDVRASLGWQIAHEAGRAWALRAQVKLPTGDVDSLTGSGATDVALWVEHARAGVLGFDRASLNAALGAVYLGEGDLVPDVQEDVAGYAHAGIAWRASDGISFIGQLDYHTRLIDSGLDQLGGRALQGSLGARFRYGDRLTTDVTFVEDLTADSVADVEFQVLMAVRL